VGVGTEFTQICAPRLPPFPPKQNDTSKPKHGWLGASLANRFKRKGPRMLITAFLYIMSCAFSFFLLYSFFIADVDNLRGLFQGNESQVHVLLWVGVIASALSLVPITIVEFGMIPGLFWDCCRMQHASKAYDTDVFEIAEIDDDNNKQGKLQTDLGSDYKAISLTIVIPCYLPNEEEILPTMIDFYEKQLEHYPGEGKILIVWNSPKNHPEFEAEMRKREEGWKTKGGLVVKRCLNSTSKCDNLTWRVT